MVNDKENVLLKTLFNKEIFSKHYYSNSFQKINFIDFLTL